MCMPIKLLIHQKMNNAGMLKCMTWHDFLQSYGFFKSKAVFECCNYKIIHIWGPATNNWLIISVYKYAFISDGLRQIFCRVAMDTSQQGSLALLEQILLADTVFWKGQYNYVKCVICSSIAFDGSSHLLDSHVFDVIINLALIARLIKSTLVLFISFFVLATPHLFLL